MGISRYQNNDYFSSQFTGDPIYRTRHQTTPTIKRPRVLKRIKNGSLRLLCNMSRYMVPESAKAVLFFQDTETHRLGFRFAEKAISDSFILKYPALNNYPVEFTIPARFHYMFSLGSQFVSFERPDNDFEFFIFKEIGC